IHSNAATDGTNTNYPLLLYRGTDGSGGDKVAGRRNMCLAIWERCYPGTNPLDTETSYSHTNKNIHGDITFYHSSSTYGYLGALKHNTPGLLGEGYFHTYHPARHRALHRDYCGQEGIRYARAVADYFGFNGESKGYIAGTVKSASESLTHNLYKYKANSIDAYKPINGAIVTLYKGGTKVKSYTVDNKYNGVFVFDNLTPGSDYTLTVSASGYETPAATNYTVTANNTTFINLRLNKGSGIDPDPDPDPEPTTKETGMLQVWKTTNVPSGDAIAESRQGFGRNDKFYVQNKSDKQIHVYNKSGNVLQSFPSGAGTNFTYDDVGNLIVRTDGFAISNFKTDQSNLRIISADGSTVKDLTLTGVPSGRCDFFGKASGDLLSDEGGKFYISPANATGVYVTSITSGEYDAGHSYTASVSGVTLTTNTSTVINSYIAADEDMHAVYVPRTSAPIQLNFNTNDANFTGKTLSLPNYDSSNGIVPFTLGGKNFIAYPYLPSGSTTHYLDGFAVAEINDSGTGTIIAKHDPVYSAAKNSFQANWRNIEYEGGAANPVYIYQYYPGGYFAKYLFYYDTEKPDVTPTVKGIFAYDLSCAKNDDDSFTFNFSANSAAESGSIIFYDATTNTQVGTVNLTSVTEGSNTVNVPYDNIPGVDNQQLTWAVKLTGDEITAYKRLNGTATDAAWLYTRATVAIDNNTESPYFGRIYVNDRVAASNTKNGLYAYRPSWVRINSNPYTGGQTWNNNYRLAVGPNGKIYVGDNGASHSGIFVADPANLSGNFTQLFSGTRDTSTGDITNGGVFVGGRVPGVSLIGSGANTKLFAHMPTTSSKISVYNLGESDTWSAAPSNQLANAGALLLNADVCLVATESGGVWASQTRALGNNVTGCPSLLYVNSSGNVVYNSGEKLKGLRGSQGSGFAVSPDGQYLAIHSLADTIRLYKVTWSGETPSLTWQTNFMVDAQDSGGKVYQMAFDWGNNLFVAGGNVGVYSIVNANNTTTVPARSAFAFTKARNGLLGDVNDDKIVNITDATLLVSRITGGTPSPFIENNADIDKNNIVNITDLTLLIQMLLE
ncbi:MAG: carboxypeptidase regulatory-like domain-containing protein, partial [Muribaculaceae bacterium]|nr:carboxypeptidase regulatory-like domain-containing protein [Muribaculaceae bacterium]